jgi:phage gpG-like protein
VAAVAGDVSITIQIPQPSIDALRGLKVDTAKVMRRMARAMDQENELTIDHAVERYLSFPKSRPPVLIGLRNMSNHLRRSYRASRAVVAGNTITSDIGSNVKYAAAHEWGVQETVRIPAHPRYSTESFTFMRLGRKKRGNQRVNKLKSEDKMVRAHTRRMRLPARAPIGRAVTDRMEQYVNSMQNAVIDAIRDKPAQPSNQGL